MKHTTHHVALVTDSERPQLSESDRYLATALDLHEIDVAAVPWDRNDIDWTMFDAVVLRSCWNYIRHISAFQKWLNMLELARVRLWSAPQIVRWNMDKRYLGDLAERGIPITPTVWLDGGTEVSLPAILDAQGWDDVVIKPRMSASAHGIWQTSRIDSPNHQPRFGDMLTQGGVMVQKLIEEIHAGEWSLVFFGNRFSHAVLKQPSKGDILVQQRFGGSTRTAFPSQDMIRQAEHVLHVVERTLFPGSTLLYARVDGLEVNGQFMLMELEVIEPGLFLDLGAPLAADRFAEAIVAMLPRQ